MAARRKSCGRRASARRTSSSRRSSGRGRTGKARAKARPRPAEEGGVAALARRIVRATVDPAKFSISDLYTADCVSSEAAGGESRGHAGIEEKLRRWESMQTGTRWKARRVLLAPNAICIEWDAEVTLRDGRVVKLAEVAIHEIRGGKIARERFYYNPAALRPPAPA